MRLVCKALLSVFIPVAALVTAHSVASAQEPPAPDTLGPYGRVVQTWIALRVSPGRESHAMQRIRDQVKGWKPGALGGLVRTVGEGSPHRVVACGLDETSFVVSQITDDGYLRVHVAGARAHLPTWDAMHMGQRIVVQTSDRADASRVRAVPGVFAVRSTHLWRRLPGTADAPVTLDDLWIDVGAKSRADVAALGIRLLDPVFRDMPDWSAATAVVGPAAAARAGCAAVVTASEMTPGRGRTTFVVAAQSAFSWAGLSAVLATLPGVDEVFVVSPDSQRIGRSLRPRTQFPGTLVETIAESELRALFQSVAEAAGMTGETNPARVRLSSGSSRPPQPSDSLSRYADLLVRLTDTYAASGDEGAMREVVRVRLPEWARTEVTTDTAGNLLLAMGPERDTVVFVAHMDEVGFEVVREENETVVLRQLGGFYPWLFAGQPAVLHVRAPASDRAQGCRPNSGVVLKGVFLPDTGGATRPSAAGGQAGGGREVRAWFGDHLERVHSAEGLKVTGFKCATRLASTRFSARSIDDRLGSAALILALDGIDRTKLDHKVIFVWSVREETSLGGARAVAASLGPTVRRVHAVDTYVSADSPLETGRFAVVPIGSGAVVRALDNSSVTPPDEIERVVRIARSSGIPLQVNTTNGGNDGSVFVPRGAVDVPVSWPLRYSHSPAEVIDLRDMRSLARLVTALALAPVR